MRSAFFVLFAATLATGCAPATYDKAPAYGPDGGPRDAEMSPVSVVLASADGRAFPTYTYGGGLYVAGEEGARYELRLINHTAERYEAVVTVDGRDVVSGELGNYKKQRGYVLGPYETVVIDGYRRSLDEVAAFRFSAAGAGYSARRGTPQHAGVVGVALFSEKPGRHKAKPIATGPRTESPEPFPAAGVGASSRDGGRDARKSAPAAPVASESAASDDAERAPGAAEADYAEPPSPTRELGTAYGESDYSPVHETEFKRRRRRRPDGVLTLHYDSVDGLRARGVIPTRIDPYAEDPYAYDRAQAEDGFAPAP